MNISIAKRAAYYRVGDNPTGEPLYKRGRALTIDGHKFNDAEEVASELVHWYLRAAAGEPINRIIVRKSDYEKFIRFGIWDELDPPAPNVVHPTSTPDRLKAIIDQIYDLIGRTQEVYTAGGPGKGRTFKFGTDKNPA